ncbi:MAG: DUF4384 domain-containing protein [Proteobacteria bacterium]|nr:DUF4384 domain-containing protein [Pseudomonadota bacterium]MBU4011942.1 DUF4384 domain-containing protein [Pseudomonadota bacterium]MBU4067971.1 DUF4384 domain-containing protein [Pseudomonadota bacterium]
MGNYKSVLINSRIWLAFLAFNLMLVIPQTAGSQNGQPTQITPDKEKRSCIQSVDGFAYLSEDMTLNAVRKVAFANAKRQAVEMAKTYIQSKTRVEDFVLKSDEITAAAEGAVTILEQKDHGVVDNTRYHVWIKAEVEYVLKPKVQQADKDIVRDKNALLTVKVWTSKKHYRDGENIEIYIQGNKDFYAMIVDIMSGGDIIQLLPNEYRTNDFFQAGKVYKIPDKGDLFELEVTAPYGEDQIVVYASEVPLGKVEMESIGQGLGKYRGSMKALATMTRGVSVVSAFEGSSPETIPMSTDMQTNASAAEFYEATWSLTTGR